jgi:hypothetical protein
MKPYVIRGGSLDYNLMDIYKPSFRLLSYFNFKINDTGFRLIKTIKS